ncbi:MAG TPA: hypothetical protein VM053_01815 [Gemmatimonadaceae bacterium]|nr:hypothetical protein [Gemmatimonadaceae bacterium]
MIIEVHPRPADALSDSDQSLTFDAFAEMMRAVRLFAEAAGRTMPVETPAKLASSAAA